MKYTVKILPEAQEDIERLEKSQKNKLLANYKSIQEVDINAVYIKSLGNKLFEIKTSELRSLFEHRNGQIIIIAVVFVKKTQKTPEIYIKRVKRILENYKEI